MDFDQIIIETSPFVRTMMTASAIALELGISKIETDYTLCESLQKWMFPECPISKLEIENMDLEELKKKYMIDSRVQIVKN